MIANNSQPEEMEAFPIPEGAILLDACEGMTSRELAIAALQKIIKDRELTLPLGPELDLNNPKRLLILNRFAIEVLTVGMTTDEISIPLEHWYRAGAAPQILLAAQIDEENNVVSFPGVLTGEEFKQLVSNQLNNQKEVSISLTEFKGGVDRLLSFVRLLEPSAITREGFANKADWSWKPITKKIKSSLSITAFGLAVIVLGPQIFRPRLLGGVAMLSGDSIEIANYTRSYQVAGPKTVVPSACLLSPSFVKDKENLNAISFLSIDKPLIFSIDPLNEIKISRGGNIVWSQSATIEKPIRGSIPWPIAPIKAGEKLVLSIRPKGTSMGEEAKIILQANSIDRFQKLDTIINSLGNKESRWIKTINQNLEQDRNLALTLLFSDQAPKSKVLDHARSTLLEKEGCLKGNN